MSNFSLVNAISPLLLAFGDGAKEKVMVASFGNFVLQILLVELYFHIFAMELCFQADSCGWSLSV